MYTTNKRTSGILQNGWRYRSFCICDISANVNGSEDNEIHCLKDSSVASNSCPAIFEVTCQLLDEADNDHLHPSMKTMAYLIKVVAALKL